MQAFFLVAAGLSILMVVDLHDARAVTRDDPPKETGNVARKSFDPIPELGRVVLREILPHVVDTRERIQQSADSLAFFIVAFEKGEVQ